MVISVPTDLLPKRLRFGSTVGQDLEALDRDQAEAEDDIVDDMGERGHILWIRGLSRLQHQVTIATQHATMPWTFCTLTPAVNACLSEDSDANCRGT